MTMGDSLKDKIALVTGGASGIGRASALALSREGARVVVFDKSTSPDAHFDAVTGDVTSESSVLALFEHVKARYGRLDVVVNSAGVQVERALVDTSVADFDFVMNVNVKGTFLVGREAVRMMMGQPDGGRVINVSSELAYLGRAKYSVYVASKAAILGFTRSWAREFAPKVLVNAVAPGPTDTPLLSAESMSPEVLKGESNVPLQRIARPEEIAHAVVFLAGPGATYFTGQCVSPNGGAVML
jgi:3-oxoacyl-[acyl-carrier protein] reductase